MTDFHLALDYKLAAGWLAPWFDSLRLGKALGRRCTACGLVSFAPLRVCDCGSDAGDWHALSGEAAILYRTSGLDGNFALVRFDGAATNTVVRLDDQHPMSSRASLQVPPADDLTTTVCTLPELP